jgi:hypothetical protein
MTKSNDLSNELRSMADNEAVQGVVDRMLSWHQGAPADTVREHLAKALDEVGESKDEAWLKDVSERISQADPAKG